MPGTIDASSACGSGTTTRLKPCACAVIVIGSTPGTLRSRPSRLSSPMNTKPSSIRGRTGGGWSSSLLSGGLPAAASTPIAIARSKCGPRLGRSAGDSRIVTRRVTGQV